jgi:hypothetical protein
MPSAVKIAILLASFVTYACVNASAADWMLRVQTMGRICHVQLKTASPLGEDFKGPFSSRKAACQEGANQYDESLSDTSKCWEYGGGTVSGCKTDGITLPPKRSTKTKGRRR